MKNIFNVYILQTPTAKQEKSNILTPIQKLHKHGLNHKISFFHYDNHIYCLLGSTQPDEKR